MYFQRAGSTAVLTRLRKHNHLRFIDPELKLTLALLPGAGAETGFTRAFYSERGSKLQPGYFPGAGSASEQTYVNHRYGANTKGWAGFGAGSIRDRRPPNFHIRFLCNEATNSIPAGSLQKKLYAEPLTSINNWLFVRWRRREQWSEGGLGVIQLTSW